MTIEGPNVAALPKSTPELIKLLNQQVNDRENAPDLEGVLTRICTLSQTCEYNLFYNLLERIWAFFGSFTPGSSAELRNRVGVVASRILSNKIPLENDVNSFCEALERRVACVVCGRFPPSNTEWPRPALQSWRVLATQMIRMTTGNPDLPPKINSGIQNYWRETSSSGASTPREEIPSAGTSITSAASQPCFKESPTDPLSQSDRKTPNQISLGSSTAQTATTQQDPPPRSDSDSDPADPLVTQQPFDPHVETASTRSWVNILSLRRR